MQKEVVCPSCPPSRYVASATAVDNSAPLQVVQVPTYKSGFVVQTNAATSVLVNQFYSFLFVSLFGSNRGYVNDLAHTLKHRSWRSL